MRTFIIRLLLIVLVCTVVSPWSACPDAISPHPVFQTEKQEIEQWFQPGRNWFSKSGLSWDCGTSGITINLALRMKKFRNRDIIIMDAISREGKKVTLGVKFREDGYLYVYDNPGNPDAYVFCVKNRRTAQWLPGEIHYISCGWNAEGLFVAFTDSFGSAPADAVDPKKFPERHRFLPVTITGLHISNQAGNLENIEILLDSSLIRGKNNPLEDVICKVIPPENGIFLSSNILLPSSLGFVIEDREGYLKKNARLVVECPEGISPYNELTVNRVCAFPFTYDIRGVEKFECDGKTYYRYRFFFPHTPKDQVTEHRLFGAALFWGTDLPEKQADEIVMYMEWDGGRQPAASVPVRILAPLADVERFETMPIGLWGNPFSPGIKNWCAKTGVNFLAPHIPAADNENAGAVIEEAKERLAGTGIELDLYSLKIWWGPKWDQDKAVTRIDGTKNMSFPCLSYRGKEFFEDRERAKNFILQGFSGIYTDIECEVYKGCFCERCVNGFRKFMEEKHPELGWIEPKDFAGTVLSPNPENQKAWLEYIGFLMSEYYLSLCDGIGEAAAMLKLTNPPRLTIYNDGDIRAGVAGADLSHLLAQKNPGAEVLCGPPVYSGPAGGGDRVRNLRKTYPETLIYPHIGRAPEIPRFNMEYLVYEIIANGARGFHIYSHTSLDGEELSQLSTSAGVIRKVERFIASSHLLDEPFDPDKDTRIRAIGNNHRMLILVARYQKTGTVEVTVPVEVASSVINLKTGKMLCSIRPGKNTFSVSFDQPGAVLFMVDRQL